MRRKATTVLTVALAGSVLVAVPASGAGTTAQVKAKAKAKAAARWRNVSSKALKTGGSLDHIDVVSRTSAFAIGSEGAKAKLLRWNGKSWQRQKSSWNFIPTGIAAAGPKKAWAIGLAGNKSAALYWNGKSWKKVAYASPPLAGVIPALPAQIAAAKDGAAFSIASFNAYNGGLSSLMRWNGARWVPVRVPMPVNTSLTAVSVRSKKDVWVGGTVPNAATHALPVSWHWNGKSWKKISIPGDWGLAGTQQNTMTDLLAVGAKSVWALRAQGRGGLLHWNGSAWREVGTPLGVEPYRLAADGRGGVWVLPVPTGAKKTRYLHWSGRWTVVSGPGRSGATKPVDLDWMPGTKYAVSVGSSSPKGSPLPIIEVFR
ncbi:MAG: hypothetical protein ABIS86_20820 [Streptosporangiaceae bacterium]